MLRSVDGWEGEHFSFGAASAAATAAPTVGPTQIAIDNGSDGPSATIPDSHLLFTAQFSRAGADLVLTGEAGKAFVVHDYFATDVHARLLSPEGAALSPDVVAALAGPQAPGQYAQAGTAQPPAQAVGRVVQADSDATIVRNGVAMAAHAGDAILKSDVLQTVAGTFGVTFNDGSTLNLTANSRLVVNEFVYDPKGSANSQLLDLVQGSLTFISGEVAHNGDMKIGTPVATMAIRGTVGGVTTANDGTVNFYVSQSATGAVILDSRGNIIANVVQDGPMILVRPVGPLQVLAEEIQKTPVQLATELAALQQILSIKAIGDQILQQNQQQDPNANPNPQSTDKPHTQFQIDLHFTNPNGPNGTPDPNDGNPAPPTSAIVTQTTTDGDGNKTTTVDEIKIPANLAPLTFGPLQQTANEDTALVFSSSHGNAISVFDADTASLTVTVAATHGVLSLSGVAGLTFTNGDGSGDATMTFSGTQAAINAALEGMSFTPAADYSGSASVSVSTSDGHSTSATDTIAITVAAVNDAPVIDYFKLTVAEGGTAVLSSGDFHITDPDSSSFFFSVSNVTGGQFQVFNGETWVSAPTGGFTVSDIAAGHVRFVHDGGENAPTFSIWASDFTDAGPAKSPTVVFENVNDAPVIAVIGTVGTADQIQHDTSTGLALGETFAVRGLAVDGQFLYVDDGGAEIDIYTLAGSFIESHAVDNLAGGSNQMTFADGHLYARNGGTIYLISTQNWSSTAVSVPEDQGLLTSKQWMTGDLLSLPDGRVGVMGANEDGTTTLRLYTVPTDGTSFTWSEDIILQTAGLPSDNHGAASDGTYIYIADYGINGYRSYSLATGELVYTSGDITDSGTGADLSNPTFLTHDHVNGEYIFGSYDTPAVLLSVGYSNGISVAENTTAVTTVTASDADAGTTLTYSIAGGADSALFDIDSSTGVLTFKTAPDYEAPADHGADNIYDVTVQVSDGALTDSKELTITVTNVDDGPPVPQPGVASVSEEGLSHGIADNAGTADTTDSTIATGTIAATGGGQLTFTLGLPTTALTSGGHPIIWALDDYGTLAGKVGAQTIITMSINDNGDYTVTLLGPVDHADSNGEDVKDLSIPVNVSNGIGTTATTLSVKIEDDSPAAADVNINAVAAGGSSSANLVIVLDVSGSMNTVVGDGLSRLDLAKAAVQNLLATTNIDINQVMVIAFSGGVAESGVLTWTDKGSADTFIQGLGTGGGTWYDAALTALENNWGESGPTQADQTLLYFITDGQPTSGHGANTTNWEGFFESHNIDISYAIGISTQNTNAALAPIAWTSTDPGFSPIILQSSTGLNDTLQDTVSIPTHNIFADAQSTVGFGADGGFIRSIEVDGVKYTFDGDSSISVSGSEGPAIHGTSISVSTALGGVFVFYFAGSGGHAAGDWTYTPPVSLTAPAQEVFHYVLTDNDGDKAGADINVSVTAGSYLPAVDLDSTQPGAGFEVTASTHDAPVAVFGDHATITDADSANLQSALVSFQGDYVNDDLYVDGTGLAGATIEYNGHAGTYAGLTWQYSGGGSGIELTITGDASVATYAELLDAVRFSSHSSNLTDREVSVTVNDGVNDSAAATATIHLDSLIHWTSALGGDWYLPDNWTSGPYVPGTEGSADDVSILLPVDHTVSLADRAEIGNLTVGAGVTLDVTNDPDVSSGSLYVYGDVSGAGRIVASDGGYIYFDSRVESDGHFLISGGKIEFAAGVKDGFVVSFDIDTSDVLQLDTPSVWDNVLNVSGFGAGDTLAIHGGIDNNSFFFQDYGSQDLLHYSQGGIDSWIWLTDGDYSRANFSVVTSGEGDTLITYVPTISWAAPGEGDNVAFGFSHVGAASISVDWGDGGEVPDVETGSTSFSHFYDQSPQGPVEISVGNAIVGEYNVAVMAPPDEGASNGYVGGTTGNDILIAHDAGLPNIINGMGGNDVMFASAASDTFVFSSDSHGTIVGFDTTSDHIDVSELGIFNNPAIDAFLASATDTVDGTLFSQGDNTLLVVGVHQADEHHITAANIAIIGA